jgi:hypothetical protein
MISVADPDPGSGAFLTPGSGSGMKILDHFPRAYTQFFGLKILKFFDADPGSFRPWIRDGKIWVWDPE